MPESKKSPLQFSLALALSGKGAIPDADYKRALAAANTRRLSEGLRAVVTIL